MAISASMQLNIMILMLVVTAILLIVAISKKKEGYKLVCNDCAAAIDKRRACNMIGYPYVYPTGCGNAGDLLGSKPYWSQASPMWPNGACADQLQSPCKEIKEAQEAVSKDIQGATSSGNTSATASPATIAPNATTKTAVALSSNVPMSRRFRRREGFTCGL